MLKRLIEWLDSLHHLGAYAYLEKGQIKSTHSKPFADMMNARYHSEDPEEVLP